MDPNIEIFGREIPLYGVFYFGGIFAAAVAACLARRRRIPAFDLAASAVFAVLFGVLGAKVFFLALNLRMIITQHIPVMAWIKGGFVFYGGLIGGAFGLEFYLRIYHLHKPTYFAVYATVLPLGHAIGRIGCYTAGCCYGIPFASPVSVVYTETAGSTPLGVPLFPVQLVEAILLLLLFSVQISLVQLLPRKRHLPVLLYLTVYPIIRFSLEFLRGDAERGILLGLSTSQWVSLLILGVTVAVFLRYRYVRRRRRSKN